MRKLFTLALFGFFISIINAQTNFSPLNTTPVNKYNWLLNSSKPSNKIPRSFEQKANSDSISLTIQIQTPGTLKDSILVTQQDSVIHLTITGSIDARDFAFMRDSLTNLASLDLNNTLISAYSGTGGSCINISNFTYPADELPMDAFCNENVANPVLNLKKIILPENLKSIGAFALALCHNLTEISISEKITTIGEGAFIAIEGPISVHPDNQFYCSADGILYDKDMKNLFQVTRSKKGKLMIPETIHTIGIASLFLIDSLDYIDIPVSVKQINNGAFFMCSGIDTIAIHVGVEDLSVDLGIFSGTDLSTITLLVPRGKGEAYKQTLPWSFFGNIVEETTSLSVSKNTLILDDITSGEKINILSLQPWTVSSDCDWIQLDKNGGTGDDTLQIKTNENTGYKTRIATLTFHAQDKTSICTVIQTGKKYYVTNTAGNISNTIGSLLKDSLSNLEITGTMDARDFLFLRDSMEMLYYLDISKVKIVAYSGLYGTSTSDTPYNYSANAIPQNAFYSGYSSTPLINVQLPASITSINYVAFSYCKTLREITFPAGLISINSGAFSNCTSLKSVTIPDKVTTISSSAFENCSSLSYLYLGESLTGLNSDAFKNCSKLQRIEIAKSTPMVIYDYYNVFEGVDTEQCRLIVPVGALSAYQNAYVWKNFKNISEVPYWLQSDIKSLTVDFSVNEKTINIISNVKWTATSDQSWLKINVGQNTGNGALRFVCDSNNTDKARYATISITADSTRTVKIMVMQLGGPFLIQSEAGKIRNFLPAEIRNSVNSLVISGTVNYRDFIFLRDSMPDLYYIDMKEANILAYSGSEGNFAANTVPGNAFSCWTSSSGKLISVKIPVTCTDVREYAFSNNKDLSNIELGPDVANIGHYAFIYCYGLKNIKLPISLRKVEYGAFSESGVESVVVPDSVHTLESYVFQSCPSLKSVTIPAKLTSIDSYAFNSKSISSIYCKANTPLKLTSYSVFYGTSTGTCKLYVPKGSKALYKAANQWSDFVNIIDSLGFSLSEDTLTFVENTVLQSTINTSDKWSVFPLNNWIHVQKNKGSGNDTIKVNIDPNPTIYVRTGKIEVKSPGFISQFITVIQKGKTISIETTAGNLRTKLSREEMLNGTILEIKGTLDARDFRVLRDSMPMLCWINLSNTEVLAYSGTDGTVTYQNSYPANEIPAFAFYKELSGKGKTTLIHVNLPQGLQSIGKAAFGYASGIKYIHLPETVTRIGDYVFMYCTRIQKATGGNKIKYYGDYSFFYCKEMDEITPSDSTQFIGERAFSECYKLTTFHFPATLTTLRTKAFFVCSGLKSVEIPSGITVLEDDVFNACTSLTEVKLPATLTDMKYGVFYSCTSLKEIVVPQSVTHFGPRVFGKCTSLLSISIPAAVQTIKYGAFEYCTGLRSIYSYSPIPVDLSASYYALVFNSVVKNSCTLYVPTGSKNLYAEAEEWSEFIKVVEMTTAIPSLTNQLHIYPLPATDKLTIENLPEESIVTISDLKGRTLIKKEITGNSAINVSQLEKGIYILQLSNRSSSITKKFTKR